MLPRRRPLFSLGAAGLLGWLAACGSDATETSSGSGGQGGGSAPGSGSAVSSTSTTASASASASTVGSTGAGGQVAVVARFDGNHRFNTGDDLGVDAAPDGLLANDSGNGLAVEADELDVWGATVELSTDGSFSLTGNPDFFGPGVFSYTATDGTDTAEAYVRVVGVPARAKLAALAGGRAAGFYLQAEAESESFGRSVSGAGDVNGDGVDDLVIGAPDRDESTGRSYVVFGRTDGALPTLAGVLSGDDGFVIDGAEAFEDSGHEVRAAGDVNGDGFGDLIICAPQPYQGGAGRAYVVFGKADGSPVDLGDVLGGEGGFTIQGTEYSYAGYHAGGAGDVNGDGLDDLVVGGPNVDDGRAYVVFGKADGDTVYTGDILGGSGGFGILGAYDASYLGASVAAAGDVNGDGLDDVIVGAIGNDYGDYHRGSAYVVFGKTNTSLVSASDVQDGDGGFSIHGEAEYNYLGHAVAGGGDIDGDGLDDVVVTAPVAGDDYQGRVYVVFGTDSGAGRVSASEIADGDGGFLIDGDRALDFSGISVATGSDIDGDGWMDVVVGAENAYGGDEYYTGRTFVVFGKAGGAPVSLTEVAGGDGGFVIEGEAPYDYNGRSVGLSDVNGDGHADVITSSLFHQDSSAARVYVVFGADFSGAVTTAAGPDDDALTATVGDAATDVLVADAGDDVLTLDGGPDVAHAGAGDDRVVVVDTSFRLIRGGGGFDSLAVGKADMALDLGAVPRTRIGGIEQIDLTGFGDNALTLSAALCRSISPSGSPLTVLGGAGDTVTLPEAADGEDDGDFTVYSFGGCALRVHDDITVE